VITPRLRIVILGLSITSSWGNGHATTYRGLVRGLAKRGHDVLFLERDQQWYADNRDLPNPPFGKTVIYSSITELRDRFSKVIREADLVIVGSYVPQGITVGHWVLSTATGIAAFYDIDTPVTLAAIDRGDCKYLSRSLMPRYDLYLSFTGGPTLARLESIYDCPRARALYCSADTSLYYPELSDLCWDLGYMGTYSADRQPALEALLLAPARRSKYQRFVVAGPMFPDTIVWPQNVQRIEHLDPPDHRGFYNMQKFTLNVTRADMVKAGYSPSVRLFEAAACGTPIISDCWRGLEECFAPGTEVLLSKSPTDTMRHLSMPDEERRTIGERLRRRVLREHTAEHRAEQLEGYALDLLNTAKAGARRPAQAASLR
jgi:spore maturation protein CgeB